MYRMMDGTAKMPVLNPALNHLWGRLLELRRQLSAGMESGLSTLDALNLTVPQAMALFRLVEQGPLSVSQLQTVTGRSQAATSHLVAQLERKRLASRKSDPKDARRTLVGATAKAETLVRQVDGLRQRGFAKALRAVPTGQIRKLDEALAAVLASMGERQ
jgi:DNA-binding MarR family transcriptional regulator